MAERNRYGTAEQRVLAWLERADFNGTGCWHSQDTIAGATQCCKRTVIRSIANLEAAGRIDVQRFPRGSRRCNVYRVKHWNPHKRSGVLNVLAALREARKTGESSECHSKRTAALSRARNAVASTAEAHGKDHRFLGESRLKNQKRWSWDQSAGRAREASENGLRRSCMEQRRANRHLQSVDLAHQDLLAELERKDTIIRTLQVELNKAMEGEAEWREAAKAAGRATITAKSQLTRQQKESAKLEQIDLVANHWRHHRPKASKAFGKPGSKSFTVIEKALVLMVDDEAGPVRACCEAIDGLHLAPFQHYDRRYATDGPGRVYRADVEHALGDEQRIERCREIARKARATSLDRLFEAVQRAGDVWSEWADRLVEERCRRGAEPWPEDHRILVDGVLVDPNETTGC